LSIDKNTGKDIKSIQKEENENEEVSGFDDGFGVGSGFREWGNGG
jgi:hypothetical protein